MLKQIFFWSWTPLICVSSLMSNCILFQTCSFSLYLPGLFPATYVTPYHTWTDWLIQLRTEGRACEELKQETSDENKKKKRFILNFVAVGMRRAHVVYIIKEQESASAADIKRWFNHDAKRWAEHTYPTNERTIDLCGSLSIAWEKNKENIYSASRSLECFIFLNCITRTYQRFSAPACLTLKLRTWRFY